MTLGERIRYLRRSRDWTQGDLEKHAGVPQFYGTVLLGSDGKKQLEPAHIEAIAKAFDIPLVDLLSGLEEPVLAQGEVSVDCGDVDVIVEQGEQETIVSHSTAAVNGKEEQATVVDRQVSVHTFTVPPARVGAEFRVSLQISSDKWAGVRVWTERPCTPEDVEATREAVITETREALDHQYRKLLHEAAAAYRLEQPELRIS